MEEQEKVRTELASNAEWILFREVDGSVTAESRTDETELDLSVTSLKELKSLMALVEGSGVEVE
ncbi:MAG: hypothetical protein HWN68_02325 [Desulfobacterales bacterium]|nr:hypothetical protein [Desulfobacterales bacterium]